MRQSPSVPRQEKTWVYDPKPKKSAVPEATKNRLSELAAEIIKTDLFPQHVKPARKNDTFNYIVDIYTKWYRNYFYFCAKYHCPGPNALSPYFETKFARLGYLASGKYELAYQRHNGQWWVTNDAISAANAMKEIKEGGLFTP